MVMTQNRERLRWRGPATTENYRPDLSSERALHISKPVQNCLMIIKGKREKKWSRTPDGSLTPRQTGRLTGGRKLILTLTIHESPKAAIRRVRS
jgi:hypothetical protein